MPDVFSELPKKINYYLPSFDFADKLKDNFPAIVLGSAVGLSFPILIMIDHMMPVNLHFGDKVYFLVYILGPSLGIIVTDFLLMFFAGYLAADKSRGTASLPGTEISPLADKIDKLFPCVVVGIIVPFITAILNWGLLFLDTRFFANIFLYCLYAVLGGLCNIYFPFRPRKTEVNRDWSQFQG